MDPRSLGIALASSVGLGALTGHAELLLPGATLEVRNSASGQICIDEGRLAAKIRAQLSAQTSATGLPPQRRFEVTIADGSGGLVADLRVSGITHGVRRIEAARCAGLADALAVTVAMILDREAQVLREQVSKTPNQGQAPAQAWQPESTAANLPASGGQGEHSRQRDAIGSQDKINAAVEAGSGVRSTFKPEWRAWLGAGRGTWETWDIESGVAVYTKNWGLELGAFYQPSSDHELDKGQVRVSTVGGVTAGCLRHGMDWRATLCLRATVGSERVRGIGFDRPQSTVLPIVTVGPSVGVELGSRWIAGLNLIGQLGLLQDNYVVENGPETLKNPSFTAWLIARVALSSRSPAH